MGFQIQNDLPTIELELMKAFKSLLDEIVKIYPSGRTDRYVHAVGQVFHVDIQKELPTYGLSRGLNSFLPSDIYIRSCEKVEDSFHARFSATKKEYRYYINVKEYNPITAYQLPFISNLDIKAMESAIQLLVGTHDYRGFASGSIDSRKNTIKTIYSIDLIPHNGYLEFRFIGNGFLKYQIRRMMGLVIEIGRRKEKETKILEILEKKDPGISHNVAEGCGLYLYQVYYD